MANTSLFVLDASIAIRWFFIDEPLRNKALSVRATLIDEPQRFIVPGLFYSEFVHVMMRKSNRDALFVNNALDLILRLGLRSVAQSTSTLHHTIKWCAKGLSGYDATYVALAEDVGGKWITADGSASEKAGTELAIPLNAWV